MLAKKADLEKYCFDADNSSPYSAIQTKCCSLDRIYRILGGEAARRHPVNLKILSKK